MFISGFFFFGGGGGGGGGGGVSTLVIIIIIVIVVVLICVCVCACMEEDKDEYKGYDGPRTPCYLCLSKIPDGPWNDRSHRRTCAINYSQELATMPTPYNVSCPKCNQKLRQWPNKGPEVRKIT